MKVLFAGSECVPFVKTGGLADVMGALPKALAKEDCDVRVILPKYLCIPESYRNSMEYVTHFYMDLGHEPNKLHVGIMKLCMDGVTYYFIDNEEMFGSGSPYTTMSGDIRKFIFFDKAVLAALPVIEFIPDVIHCHDWQAGLIPVFLRTLFANTPVGGARVIMTIHNLRFQGVANVDTVKYQSGLPERCFTVNDIIHDKDANMLKGGIVYADAVTTVSDTYAREITTPEYGEGLDKLMSYYRGKLSGIVNGIDNDIYNPETDKKIYRNYSSADAEDGKRENKIRLQEELGLQQDGGKFVIGLISRLTDQKGLDLISAVMDRILCPHTQFVLIGTGDHKYEECFRWFENTHRGQVCSNIMYSDDRAHKLYAAADIMLVPSKFEPCGLTQLMALRYGTLPVVRETGGLRDTVEPYNEYEDKGNGFSFDRYESGLLLGAINYAKTVYFTRHDAWKRLVARAMSADFSWERSAKRYLQLYKG